MEAYCNANSEGNRQGSRHERREFIAGLGGAARLMMPGAALPAATSLSALVLAVDEPEVTGLLRLRHARIEPRNNRFGTL
jgi:hypothetical protein